MTSIQETIELDKNNVEFNNAEEFVRDTDRLLYLTGKAGTGKTTFLKYIKETTKKNMVILAPTGVAAINAGGITINSFFQIPFGPFVPNDSRLRTSNKGSKNKETIYTTFRYSEDKLKIIKNLELLIIDEISMVRADSLDVIDRILRVYRDNFFLPFGGVQVILIGDTFQLPPIVDSQQKTILSQFYKTPFFFNSKVIEESSLVYIELKKIYRQNEQDFIDLLNRVRVNKITQNDIQILNSKYDPTFSGNGSDYIILATHNQIVNDTNLTKLNQLETELFTCEAKVEGKFSKGHMPTDHYLKLKVGAQIMFVKNDTGGHKKYYNGKLGKIKKVGKNSITVNFDDGSEVVVKRATWHNIQYTYNKEKNKIGDEIIGTFEQFPIRLAWAITVHKSQGLTFEKVIADLSNAFTAGQVYVALSRCTSFNGLMLKTPLSKNAIKTSSIVLEFAQNETPDTLITEQLNKGKADYFYKKSREQFHVGKIELAYDIFKKALKFRNDIETDILQRFIVVNGEKLFGYKNKFDVSLKILNKSIKDLSNANEIIENLNSELSEKKEQIIHQNVIIEDLESENKELENINVEKEFQIDKYVVDQLKNKKSFSEIKSKLSKANEIIENLESEIKELENINVEKGIQIDKYVGAQLKNKKAFLETKSKLSKANEIIKNLESEKRELEKNNTEKGEQIDKYEVAQLKNKKAFKNVKSNLEKVTNKLEEFKSQNSALQESILELKKSNRDNKILFYIITIVLIVMVVLFRINSK